MKISYSHEIICRTISVRINSFYLEMVINKNDKEFQRNRTKDGEFEFPFLIAILQYSLKISIKMRLDFEQRQFVIEKHFEKLSNKEIQIEFIKKWTKRAFPHRNTIIKIVTRWKSRGSIFDKKTERKTVLDAEKLKKIRENLENYPKLSLRKKF